MFRIRDFEILIQNSTGSVVVRSSHGRLFLCVRVLARKKQYVYFCLKMKETRTEIRADLSKFNAVMFVLDPFGDQRRFQDLVQNLVTEMLTQYPS